MLAAWKNIFIKLLAFLALRADDGNPAKPDPGAAGADGAKMEAGKKTGGNRNKKNAKGGSNEAQGCGRKIN